MERGTRIPVPTPVPDVLPTVARRVRPCSTVGLVLTLVLGTVLVGVLPATVVASPREGVTGVGVDDVLNGTDAPATNVVNGTALPDSEGLVRPDGNRTVGSVTNTTSTLDGVGEQADDVVDTGSTDGSSDGSALVDSEEDIEAASSVSDAVTGTATDAIDRQVTDGTLESDATVNATLESTLVGTLPGEIMDLVVSAGPTDDGSGGGHTTPRDDTEQGTSTPERRNQSGGAAMSSESESVDAGAERKADGRLGAPETNGEDPLGGVPPSVPAVFGIGGLGAFLATSTRFGDGFGAGVVREAVGTGVRRPMSSVLSRLRPLLGLAGYQRYEADDPLVHDTRAAIYDRIQSNPGIYLSALTDATDTPMGTVRYHLKILEFEGLVRRANGNGRRRYYPIDVEPGVLETLLEDSAAREVLSELAASGPTGVGDLAARVDRDPSTITHHTTRLAEMGLVERKRDGRTTLNRLTDEGQAAVPTARAGVPPSEPAPASSTGYSAGD